MVLPLIPVVAALSAGGQLVAHSAGGLIVSSAAGSYVAGTYLSTSALASFLTGSAVVTTAGTAALFGGAVAWGYGTIAGATLTLIGGTGLFGTTIGATGITGLLMSWGILPAVPIAVPVSIGVFVLLLTAAVGARYARRVRNLRQKAILTPEGAEATFTRKEAKLAEKLILNASKPHSWLWQKLMQFFGRDVNRPSTSVPRLT